MQLEPARDSFEQSLRSDVATRDSNGTRYASGSAAREGSVYLDTHSLAHDTETLQRSHKGTGDVSPIKNDQKFFETPWQRPWRLIRGQLPDGWRFGATIGAALSLCALITNIITLIVASVLARRENGIVSYISTIRKGDCADIEHIQLDVHLIIDIVSTLLLGASNYCMQCLSAPTRSDVNGAHQVGSWLDIGVPSIKNFWYLRRRKLVLWLVLGLSSVPLHLL